MACLGILFTEIREVVINARLDELAPCKRAVARFFFAEFGDGLYNGLERGVVEEGDAI